MNSIVITACLLALPVLVGFWIVSRKLAGTGQALSPSPDWVTRHSMNFYRPMERLLDESDARFLEEHPAGGRQLAKRFRAQRRKIFRGYLHSMERDFGRICALLKLMAVHSERDRPELAVFVLRQRVQFVRSMVAIEFRLMLHTFGIGSVDVRGLIEAMQVLRGRADMLLPAQNASMA